MAFRRVQSVSQYQRLLCSLLLAFVCTGCLFGRIVYHNKPTLAIASDFDSRRVQASSAPLPLARSDREARFLLTGTEYAACGSLEALLESHETRAFLVIHRDQLVYERYFGGVSASTLLPGFSMSKTFAAALVGRALSQGLLESLDRSVTDYIPELASEPAYRAVTLEQLLRMTSGIDFDEESLAGAKLYYSTDLRDQMYAYDVKWRPGSHYLYGSVNIQLLWDVLRRRLGGETVAHYFEREIWQPLGAEQPASWSVDSESSGIEKFFGGFNATARDQARLGLLFLHGGSLNGRAILPRAWVESALAPDPVVGWVHTTDGWVRRGKYQWFLTRDGRGYFAKGYNGQYVFVVPARHAVFVRFGEGYADVDWPALFLRLADTFHD
ncbi:MAG TPA: serine hydrolase [Polyangiaceae bacterium]|nr:serine hydrolase [Polyangiaceae bacterium]